MEGVIVALRDADCAPKLSLIERASHLQVYRGPFYEVALLDLRFEVFHFGACLTASSHYDGVGVEVQHLTHALLHFSEREPIIDADDVREFIVGCAL